MRRPAGMESPVLITPVRAPPCFCSSLRFSVMSFTLSLRTLDLLCIPGTFAFFLRSKSANHDVIVALIIYIYSGPGPFQPIAEATTGPIVVQDDEEFMITIRAVLEGWST